jgi:hypothetical protein
MQSQLDPVKLRQGHFNSGRYVKAHPAVDRKARRGRFCWAAAWSISSPSRSARNLKCRLPFYGAAADSADVPKVKAPLLIQICRQRRAHQRDVAGVQDRARDEPRAVHDAHVRKREPRLPQQFDEPRYDESAARSSRGTARSRFFDEHLRQARAAENNAMGAASSREQV